MASEGEEMPALSPAGWIRSGIRSVGDCRWLLGRSSGIVSVTVAFTKSAPSASVISTTAPGVRLHIRGARHIQTALGALEATTR